MIKVSAQFIVMLWFWAWCGHIAVRGMKSHRDLYLAAYDGLISKEHDEERLVVSRKKLILFYCFGFYSLLYVCLYVFLKDQKAATERLKLYNGMLEGHVEHERKCGWRAGQVWEENRRETGLRDIKGVMGEM